LKSVHIGGELAQSLVKVVHLRKNAAYYQDDEDVGRWMRELVISCKRHLQGDPEGLDEHDRNRSGSRADGEVDKWVLASVLGRNLVDHEDGEYCNESTVEEKA
jgi:hypothetical protein